MPTSFNVNCKCCIDDITKIPECPSLIKNVVVSPAQNFSLSLNTGGFLNGTYIFTGVHEGSLQQQVPFGPGMILMTQNLYNAGGWTFPFIPLTDFGDSSCSLFNQQQNPNNYCYGLFTYTPSVAGCSLAWYAIQMVYLATNNACLGDSLALTVFGLLSTYTGLGNYVHLQLNKTYLAPIPPQYFVPNSSQFFTITNNITLYANGQTQLGIFGGGPNSIVPNTKSPQAFLADFNGLPPSVQVTVL